MGQVSSVKMDSMVSLGADAYRGDLIPPRSISVMSAQISTRDLQSTPRNISTTHCTYHPHVSESNDEDKESRKAISWESREEARRRGEPGRTVFYARRCWADWYVLLLWTVTVVIPPLTM